MNANEFHLTSIPNTTEVCLQVSKFKSIPMLIVLLLTSIVGIQALIAFPQLIENKPQAPSPNLEPLLYTAKQVEYEMEMSYYQVQLTYFGGMLFIWVLGILTFGWVAIRLSATITLNSNGVLLSRKFNLSTNKELWQNIHSITIEVTRGRRSENSLKFIIETLERSHYQIILSYLDYPTIYDFKQKLDNITKQLSPLIYQLEKSTINIPLRWKKIVWHWAVTP